MGTSKVTLNGTTLMDILDTTAVASDVAEGEYFYTARGDKTLGTASGGSTPTLQAKTNIAPTTSSQTITPDSGYDGLSSVQINAMPTGTAGTPTATKGTVSNHSVSVTPSVTNSTGYITGGTKTGTAVSVSASELVSGILPITSNGLMDVTNYANVVVDVSEGGSSTNLVSGIFTTEGSGTVQTITVPYSGNGYPIAVIILPVGGMTGSQMIGLDATNGVCLCTVVKRDPLQPPTYTASGEADRAAQHIFTKKSSSDTSFGEYSGQSSFYTQTTPSAFYNDVRMSDATTLKIAIRSSSYGFISGIVYQYYIIYSE